MMSDNSEHVDIKRKVTNNSKHFSKYGRSMYRRFLDCLTSVINSKVWENPEEGKDLISKYKTKPHLFLNIIKSPRVITQFVSKHNGVTCKARVIGGSFFVSKDMNRESARTKTVTKVLAHLYSMDPVGIKEQLANALTKDQLASAGSSGASKATPGGTVSGAASRATPGNKAHHSQIGKGKRSVLKNRKRTEKIAENRGEVKASYLRLEAIATKLQYNFERKATQMVECWCTVDGERFFSTGMTHNIAMNAAARKALDYLRSKARDPFSSKNIQEPVNRIKAADGLRPNPTLHSLVPSDNNMGVSYGELTGRIDWKNEDGIKTDELEPNMNSLLANMCSLLKDSAAEGWEISTEAKLIVGGQVFKASGPDEDMAKKRVALQVAQALSNGTLDFNHTAGANTSESLSNINRFLTHANTSFIPSCNTRDGLEQSHALPVRQALASTVTRDYVDSYGGLEPLIPAKRAPASNVTPDYVDSYGGLEPLIPVRQAPASTVTRDYVDSYGGLEPLIPVKRAPASTLTHDYVDSYGGFEPLIPVKRAPASNVTRDYVGSYGGLEPLIPVKRTPVSTVTRDYVDSYGGLKPLIPVRRAPASTVTRDFVDSYGGLEPLILVQRAPASTVTRDYVDSYGGLEPLIPVKRAPASTVTRDYLHQSLPSAYDRGRVEASSRSHSKHASQDHQFRSSNKSDAHGGTNIVLSYPNKTRCVNDDTFSRPLKRSSNNDPKMGPPPKSTILSSFNSKSSCF